MQYAGFGRRFLANVIDAIIYFAAGLFFFWLISHSRFMAIALAVPVAAICWGYDFILHGKYGQTVGKMAVGIQVRQLDGTRIGWRESLIRSSVDLAFTVILTLGGLMALFAMTSGDFSELSYAKLFDSESPFLPVFLGPAVAMQQIWTWSEMVVLLCNRKRRALHDYLAGTVVILKVTAPATAIPEEATLSVSPQMSDAGFRHNLSLLVMAAAIGWWFSMGLQPVLGYWDWRAQHELASVSSWTSVAGILGITSRYWVAALAAGFLFRRRKALWIPTAAAFTWLIYGIIFIGGHVLVNLLLPPQGSIGSDLLVLRQS